MKMRHVTLLFAKNRHVIVIVRAEELTLSRSNQSDHLGMLKIESHISFGHEEKRDQETITERLVSHYITSSVPFGIFVVDH